MFYILLILLVVSAWVYIHPSWSRSEAMNPAILGLICLPGLVIVEGIRVSLQSADRFRPDLDPRYAQARLYADLLQSLF